MTDGIGTQGGAVEPGAQGGAGSSQDGNSGTGDSGAQGGAGGESGNGQQTPPPAQETVSRADFDRLQNQLRAADQNRQKAQNELQQLRDKDMPALEKANRDLVAAQESVKTLTGKNRELAIQNAFLTDNTHEWENPKTALRLADLSKVDVDEEGNVTGVKAALDALAKSDPYLLKKPKEEGTPPPPGGTPPGNNGQGGSGKPDSKKLVERFPVMRTRVR